jgi:hypothetical protein
MSLRVDLKTGVTSEYSTFVRGWLKRKATDNSESWGELRLQLVVPMMLYLDGSLLLSATAAGSRLRVTCASLLVDTQHNGIALCNHNLLEACQM